MFATLSWGYWLARQPMSGYDVKRFLKNLSWLIDVPSFGSLYPTLHALQEDGLVSVEVVPGHDRPPRKIYSITEGGRQKLQEWMRQPAASNSSLKAFVMRLALANQRSQVSLLTHLEQRRARVAAHRLMLEQAVEALDENVELGERLTLDYGLALAAAELAWLDHTLVRLSPSSSPFEAAQATGGFDTLPA